MCIALYKQLSFCFSQKLAELKMEIETKEDNIREKQVLIFCNCGFYSIAKTLMFVAGWTHHAALAQDTCL